MHTIAAPSPAHWPFAPLPPMQREAIDADKRALYGQPAIVRPAAHRPQVQP